MKKINIEQLQKIQLDTNNPRGNAVEENAKRLEKDILKNGILKPLDVSLIDGKPVICAGNSRATAVLNLFKAGTIADIEIPIIENKRTLREHRIASLADFESEGLTFQSLIKSASELVDFYGVEKESEIAKLERLFTLWIVNAKIPAARKLDLIEDESKRPAALKGFVTALRGFRLIPTESKTMKAFDKGLIGNRDLRLINSKKTELTEAKNFDKAFENIKKAIEDGKPEKPETDNIKLTVEEKALIRLLQANKEKISVDSVISYINTVITK